MLLMRDWKVILMLGATQGRGGGRLTARIRTATVVSMPTAEPDPGGIIVQLERAALERWGSGDPDGFLEISAVELSYFDPFTERRLDGLDALRSWYDQVRGNSQFDRFEMIAPRVQVAADVAVLTYRFDSHGDQGATSWNTTEVYRRTPDGWRIIHTHWAHHRPNIVVG